MAEAGRLPASTTRPEDGWRGEVMAETWSCRTLRGALEAASAAQDGDVIQLAWPGANGFNRSAVESRLVALGVDVVVELAPEEVSDER